MPVTWFDLNLLCLSGTVWVWWTASGARFRRMDRHRSSHPTATPSVCALVVLLVPILPMVTRSVVSADWELRFCVVCVCVCVCVQVCFLCGHVYRVGMLVVEVCLLCVRLSCECVCCVSVCCVFVV